MSFFGVQTASQVMRGAANPDKRIVISTLYVVGVVADNWGSMQFYFPGCFWFLLFY